MIAPTQIGIIKTRKYKAGYVVREEIHEIPTDPVEYVHFKAAYNFNNEYIGTPKEAYYLCKKRGIKPEKANISPNSFACNIGFCESEQKWYGWSHRAICGFGIGSEVKIGDCAYLPDNIDEWIEYNDWFEDFSVEQRDDKTYKVTYKEKQNSKNELQDCVDANERICEVFAADSDKPFYDTCIVHLGNGEWTAKTLDDAKQMAIDYAKGVS